MFFESDLVINETKLVEIVGAEIKDLLWLLCWGGD